MNRTRLKAAIRRPAILALGLILVAGVIVGSWVLWRQQEVEPASSAPIEVTWPTEPPAKICGDASVLNGPATAPAGAITVPAGNNSSVDLEKTGKHTGSLRGCTRLDSR